jgi:hypothetical protein
MELYQDADDLALDWDEVIPIDRNGRFACSIQMRQFLNFLTQHWFELPRFRGNLPAYLEAVLRASYFAPPDVAEMVHFELMHQQYHSAFKPSPSEVAKLMFSGIHMKSIMTRRLKWDDDPVEPDLTKQRRSKRRIRL